jgi:anti-sigma-K factor RskA
MSGGSTGEEADRDDDSDLSAAEYVLGVLPPEQARAVEALALADPAVAASIAAWQVRLAPLADTLPPVVPPPELWQRLALATGIEKLRGRRWRQRTIGEQLWGSIKLWRFASLFATAVAAGLAFVALRPVLPPSPGYLAALSPVGAAGATFLVRVGADGTAVVVAAVPPNTPSGRSLELWALDAGATLPVSLGVLPGDGRARLRVPPRAGTQLLVSQEPEGGSPTGQPTGPVVYQGAITPGG